MPFWIDVVGKLGPLFVATAVYLANRAQNRWNTEVALRSANVEDQKLRLAILERRIRAIEAINETFLLPNPNREQMNAALAAEYVFEAPEVDAIRICKARQFDWLSLDSKLKHFEADKREGRAAIDDDEIQAASETLTIALPAYMDAFASMIDLLKQATCLPPVLPLERPRGWISNKIR